MTTQYTPRPWHPEGPTEDGAPIWIVSDARVDMDRLPIIVGQAILPTNSGGWPTLEPEEQQANAHLLTAAPDLYEAARALLAVMGWPNHWSGDHPWTREVFALVDACAKAEGRQP